MAKDPERQKLNQHKHYVAHKEEYYKRAQAYRKTHPDKVRQYQKNRLPLDQVYRDEHKEERAARERERNHATFKNVTKKHTRWTPEEIQSLKSLIKEGLSYTEIATKLGRSLRSVNAAKQRYCPELITENKKCHYLDVE